jgi:hypothetical protein
MQPNLKTLSLFTAAGGLLALAVVLGSDGQPKPDPVLPDPIKPIPEPPIVENDRPVVQIALLLDTSSSMDGLIEQAKSQLWKIVNAFDPAKLNGKRPRLEIAIYEYGNDSLSPASGYIRQVIPFSEELDRVSEALFALTTNGGSEYAGQALQTALADLEWSKSKGALKLAFIAGNEDFHQGPMNPGEIIRSAAAQGIVVNTIFCGPEQAIDAAGWKNGALLADGRFMTIDHNQQIVHIDAPQDKAIAELGVKLNDTYIAFGTSGMEGARRQAVEDRNSAAIGQGSAVQRGLFKSSYNYRNSSWELVDAVRDGKVKIGDLDEESLPANMRSMSKEQREAYVKGRLAERERIQSEIQKLAKERDSYVAQQQKKMAEADTGTLDMAMIDAVRGQASKKGWQFE